MPTFSRVPTERGKGERDGGGAWGGVGAGDALQQVIFLSPASSMQSIVAQLYPFPHVIIGQ